MDNLKFWSLTKEQTLNELNSNLNFGLKTSSVPKLLKTNGPNALTTKKVKSAWSILFQQLKSLIVILLFAAAILSFALSQWIEGLSVIIVLIINTIIGFVTEYRAIRSMESLREMGQTTSTVFRDGVPQIINAIGIVPGDIIIFEAGDIISADLRILEASKLNCDESILTGESVPVEKHTEAILGHVPITDKKNMLFRGTFITRGSGKAIAVATGMNTEIGKIAKITEDASDELTPLEERLNKLGQKLILISLGIALFVALAGIMSGKDIYLMLETALALAIATIPEGLPIVATMALAKGMWRMAKKNALINQLSAVETLGATSIIFTDKTGTLTENKMTVEFIQTPSSQYEFSKLKDSFQLDQAGLDLFKVSVLCNNAHLPKNADTKPVGDPMELALLVAARRFEINREEYLENSPEIKEEAFDSTNRMMATIHNLGPLYFFAVKGAPESIIESSSRSESEKKYWNEQNQKLSADGYRVLAFAQKSSDDLNEYPYKNLQFLGLMGLVDPARAGIKEAIHQCHLAGIRVAMVTGDQAGTAKKIATDIELDSSKKYNCISGVELLDPKDWDQKLIEKLNQTSIFSRVSPEQKLNIIKHYQDNHFVVAMTGDGVNDAPALKKADIGIAMGQRGTQVAKDAADMVLEDDYFGTIIQAIAQGRIIYSNIKRFVIYLLSCNISEVLVISIAAFVNAPLPLLPLQILFLNLVTDVFPALALGLGEGDATHMQRPPRNKATPIISKSNWFLILGHGLIITFCVLGAYFYTLNNDNLNLEKAVTVAFLTIGLAQLFHVFNMRLAKTSFIHNDITKNPYVWGAIFICIIFLFAAIMIAPLSRVLNVVPLERNDYFIIIIASILPLFIGYITSKLGFEIKD